MWDRSKAFAKKAGTIIFVSAIVLWFLQGFNWQLEMVDNNESILASIGNAFAFVFSPLGFGNWKATVAAVTGLIAKENVVSTFGVLYGFAEVAEDGVEIWGTLASEYHAICLQLLSFQFAVCPMFCSYWCYFKRNGQCEVDVDRNWISVLFCLCYCSYYLSVRYLDHNRCLWNRNYIWHSSTGRITLSVITSSQEE